MVRACAQFGMTRSDLVVALGGGVVGDLAGFVAAFFSGGEFDFYPNPNNAFFPRLTAALVVRSLWICQKEKIS